MRRRAFLGGVAAGPLCGSTGRPAPRVLVAASPADEWFPHVSGPRIEAVNDECWKLARTRDKAVLFAGGRRLALGPLERSRICADPEGGAHVAGTRGRELWHFRITARLQLTARRIATLSSLHPATGLDITWTPAGVLIAAAGPEPASLALYPASGDPLLLARRRWAHPLLRYDARRSRLHVVWSGWNDASSIYDVIYHLQTGDGGKSWQRADGSVIDAPFEHRQPGAEPDVLTRRQQSGGGESNTLAHALQCDENGNPHVLYSFCMPYAIGMGPARARRMQTKHVRWTGAAWAATEISAGPETDVAGGALAINGASLHALLMYKSIDADWLDLGLTSSGDGGATWSPPDPITGDASGKKAHYVAPAVSQVGRRLEYVFTAQSARRETPVYVGEMDV